MWNIGVVRIYCKVDVFMRFGLISLVINKLIMGSFENF